MITSSATIILEFQHWYDVLLIVRCQYFHYFICMFRICVKERESFLTSTLTSSRPKSNVSFK
jgi:hypothetical protein